VTGHATFAFAPGNEQAPQVYLCAVLTSCTLAQLLFDAYMPELEQLKMRMATREKEGDHMGHSMTGRTQDTVQLVTSNLPELSNWGEYLCRY